MQITLKKNQKKNIGLLMVYYFTLVIAYVCWLTPNYSYMDFTSSSPFDCVVIGVIAASILSYVTSFLIERGTNSDRMILVLILLYFYPQIVLFAHSINDYGYFAFVTCYLIVLLLLNRIVKLSDKRIQINSKVNLFLIAIVLLGVFMMVLSGVVTRFRISFDFSDFYEFRYAVRELMLPAVARYLFSWTKQILPIGLVYAIVRKKWILAIFMALSVVLCFSFDGKKSVVFMFFLAIVIGFFYKKEYLRRFPLYMVLLNIGIFIESLIRRGESFLGQHILRRLMFIPAKLGWSYYDFFSIHELDFWRSSALRHLGFKSPYSDSIPRVIAMANNAYSSRGISNANTGLCGDAFANFGWLAILIYPLIIVLVFKIIEKYMSDLDEKLQIMICISVSYSMISGAFFTVLLTNGILLIIILLILVPRFDQNLLIVRENYENTAY